MKALMKDFRRIIGEYIVHFLKRVHVKECVNRLVRKEGLQQKIVGTRYGKHQTDRTKADATTADLFTSSSKGMTRSISTAQSAERRRSESMKWLVIYDGGKQEIVEADDLYDIYNKCGSDVMVAVQLNSNIVAKSYE